MGNNLSRLSPCCLPKEGHQQTKNRSGPGRGPGESHQKAGQSADTFTGKTDLPSTSGSARGAAMSSSPGSSQSSSKCPPKKAVGEDSDSKLELLLHAEDGEEKEAENFTKVEDTDAKSELLYADESENNETDRERQEEADAGLPIHVEKGAGYQTDRRRLQKSMGPKLTADDPDKDGFEGRQAAGASKETGRRNVTTQTEAIAPVSHCKDAFTSTEGLVERSDAETQTSGTHSSDSSLSQEQNTYRLNSLAKEPENAKRSLVPLLKNLEQENATKTNNRATANPYGRPSTESAESIGQNLVEDCPSSDDENTTPKLTYSVFVDTQSVQAEDEPISLYRGDDDHHNTARKEAVFSISRNSSTGSAVERQSNSDSLAGPAVERQSCADAANNLAAGLEERVLNIERVGHLRIEVLPAGRRTGGDWPEGDGHTVSMIIDWEGARQRSIDIERRKAEERVRRAEGKIEKEKQKGVQRMKSLAEEYIRQWSTDVMEREADREKERQQFWDHMCQVERENEEEIARTREELEKEKRESEELVQDLLKQAQTDREQLYTRFIIRPQNLEQSRLTPEDVAETINARLEFVVQRLFSHYSVRLLAVDEGLLFVMEALMAQWATVQENQAGIQCLLSELVPLKARQDVEWSEVLECPRSAAESGRVIRLGQPLPQEILDNCTVPTAWNPLTASLMRVYGPAKPNTSFKRDLRAKDTPTVGALVVTESGRIVILDWRNKAVTVTKLPTDSTPCKLCDIQSSMVANQNEPVPKIICEDHAWSWLNLGKKLCSMTLIFGETVAVTCSAEKYLILLDLSVGEAREDRIRTERTERLYHGICTAPTDSGRRADSNLIVGTKQDSDGRASLYLITQRAQVLRTIADSSTCPGLCYPLHLTLFESTLYVSNSERHNVLSLCFPTGRCQEILSDKNFIREPRQLSVDRNGNLYIASVDEKREKNGWVAVVSPERKWRRLLDGRTDGDPPRVYPIGVSVTSRGLVTSWHEWNGYSVICVYRCE